MKRKTKSANLKAWRELSAKKRDEVGACEICGAKEKLQVHHIVSRRSRPDLLLDEKNLIVLCARHHFIFHRGHEAEFFSWLVRNKPAQWKHVVKQTSEVNIFQKKRDD